MENAIKDGLIIQKIEASFNDKNNAHVRVTFVHPKVAQPTTLDGPLNSSRRPPPHRRFRPC